MVLILLKYKQIYFLNFLFYTFHYILWDSYFYKVLVLLGL